MTTDPAPSRNPVHRRLQWLMIGRLVVATILLGGSLLLHVGHSVDAGSFTPQFLQFLIAATFAASAVFAFWLTRARELRRLAVVQLGWDLLVTTGLIGVTGGAASGFSFLYGVTVLMAAIVLGGQAVMRTAGAALVMYALAGVSLANGWIPSPPDQLAALYRLPPSELGAAMLANVVGLVLVAVLAGNLATRLSKTGGELRRAEASAARLARLNDDIIRSITSGIVTVDGEGRVQTINPAAAEMYHRPPDDLVGRHVSELLPVSGTPPVRDPEATSPTLGREDGTATRPDGSTFPVGYSQAPLVDSAGMVIGTLIAFQDLTEIRELRRAAERAERLAMLGRLAAGLAHEIRNPLSSISGSVELVRDGPGLEHEDRRLLGIVLSEVERLNNLVTTMLQVGRPRSPQLRPTDVPALAGDVVEMARSGPAHSAGVDIDLQASEPVSAVVDPDQIRQVLWNLVKNAIQASERAGVVRVRVAGSEDGSAEIEVEDRGRGISAKEREKLFDMFYSGRPHGVGLGLALVQQIVEAHDGQVDVESEEGRGTTFRVVLPARTG